MTILPNLHTKTQEILFELKNRVPLPLLIKETCLTEQDIIKAAKGSDSIEIYCQLLMFQKYLEAQEEETRDIVDILMTEEMRCLPPMAFCNEPPRR